MNRYTVKGTISEAEGAPMCVGIMIRDDKGLWVNWKDVYDLQLEVEDLRRKNELIQSTNNLYDKYLYEVKRLVGELSSKLI